MGRYLASAAGVAGFACLRIEGFANIVVARRQASARRIHVAARRSAHSPRRRHESKICWRRPTRKGRLKAGPNNNGQDFEVVIMKIWFVVAAVATGAAFSSPAFADMTLKSQDGTMELALPNGWHEAKSEGALAKLAATDGHGSKTEDIQVGGKPAVRTNLTGTQATGMKAGFVITVFENEGEYVDVVGKSDASDFAKQSPVLAGFASQLKITKAAPAAAAK
jgi:hypothetical protein